ncbi:MAG: hypothetical protein JHC37_07000 [Campylobacteraceae bacterium]|jgi:hypothetical protein|nr:hypothetical protein [Campylobacteraceae bacterium]
MRTALMLAMLSLPLFARENPFKALQKENLAEASMSQINKVEPLPTITITPPVESVKIKKITIEYQSIDGMKIKKTYDIEKCMDPLKTIKVSQ